MSGDITQPLTYNEVYRRLGIRPGLDRPMSEDLIRLIGKLLDRIEALERDACNDSPSPQTTA